MRQTPTPAPTRPPIKPTSGNTHSRTHAHQISTYLAVVASADFDIHPSYRKLEHWLVLCVFPDHRKHFTMSKRGKFFRKNRQLSRKLLVLLHHRICVCDDKLISNGIVWKFSRIIAEISIFRRKSYISMVRLALGHCQNIYTRPCCKCLGVLTRRLRHFQHGFFDQKCSQLCVCA